MQVVIRYRFHVKNHRNIECNRQISLFLSTGNNLTLVTCYRWQTITISSKRIWNICGIIWERVCEQWYEWNNEWRWRMCLLQISLNNIPRKTESTTIYIPKNSTTTTTKTWNLLNLLRKFYEIIISMKFYSWLVDVVMWIRNIQYVTPNQPAQA